MGKDRTPSQPVSAVPPAVVLGPDGKPQRPPKGHRQKGAGTVITAKPPVVTGDGIVLKTHERLPSQLLSEFCQREKRPNPKYFSNPPGRRMKVVLEDTKNSKNDLNFCPNQSFQSDSIARDFAALLALFHFQKTLPLERKMPEPYSTTWLTMITNDRIESAAVAQSKQGNGKASSATMETEAKKVSSLPVASSNVSNTATTSVGKQPVEVLVPVLDRNTSDWLCDSCGNSNFATLASGALRTKCFRCQCAKSATCVLVAPSSGTTPPAFTASSASAKSNKVSSNSNSSTAAATNKVSSASNGTPNTNSNSGPKLKVAPAAVANLKVDKAFVSKQDEEKAKLESTAAKRRRAAYFDALKRANKPMPVYVSQTLRKMLENVLGLNKTSLNNDAEDDEEGACLTMEAFLSDYSELITFSEELCLVTAETQLDLLREVVAGLRKKGFQERDIVRCLQLLLLTQYSEEIIETIDSTLQSKSNNTSLSASDLTDTSPIRAVFVAVITEACLSQLCIQLDEASLPAAFDPSAAQKKLVFDVYKPPAVKGGEELLPEAAQVVSALQTSGWSRKDSVAAIEVAKSVAGSAASEDDLLYASRLVLSLATFLRRCNNSSDSNNPTSLAQTIAEMTSRSTLSEYSASSSGSAGIEVLLEECESLEAIFGDKFSSRKVESEGGVAYYVLSLEVDLCGAASSAKGKQLLKGTYTMTVCVSCSAGDGCAYPNTMPLIVLHSDADSLSIPQQVALTELQCAVYSKASAEFLGECMLFQVYSFLTDSVDAILAAATSSASAPSFNTELVRVADFVNNQCSGDALAALFKTVDDSTTVEGDMNEMSVGGSSVTGGGGRSNAKNKGNHPFWVRSTDKQNRFANSSISSGNSNKSRSANYNAMQTVRRALPAWNMRGDFLSLMSANRGLVVTGETGCGKTTQIPQFIHETQPDAKIVVCQPRRLAAIGVATRIAEEMDEAVGDTVGYMVKGDSKATGKTKIVFCTYGVLLRRLQDDPTLRGIDYVILDEVHERGIDSDFTLALLMSAAAQRADLRVMLMSATIATERFAAYLASGLKIPDAPSVPVMFIPGFTFPVTEYYKGDYEDLVRGYRSGSGSNRNDEDDDGGREGGGRGGGRDGDRLGGKMRKGDIDYDLLVKLIMALCSSSPGSGSSAPRKGSANAGNDGSDGVDVGAMMCRAQGSILVFVPGVPEINRVSSLLQTSYNPRGSNDALNMRVMPLHGNLSPSDQRRVFQPAGRGEIKVIVATNVAEASITIPDVSVVIDTCRVKEMGYNVELQTSALMMKFAAQDSLLQRRGRAGRVSHGRCFRLVTRGTYEKLPAHGLPEILRSPLDNVILQIKAMLLHMPECGSSDSMFILSKCLDSPEESVVRISEQALVKIQALDPVNFALTPLGKHLSTLPCDPRVGRLLIYGALLGCVYPASCVAACMTARSPFLTSAEPEIQQKVNNAKAYFAEGCSVKSDYNVIVKALRQFESSGQRGQRSFCMQYGLSYDRMAEIRQSQSDLLQGLVDIGFLSSVREAVDSYSAASNNNSNNSSNSSRGSGSNRNAHKSKLVAAVYCAGLYPQLAKVLRPPKRFVEVMGSAIERNLEAKELKMYIPDQLVLETSAPVAGGANIGPDVKDHYFATNVDIDVSAMTRVFLHPSTVNFSNTSFRASNFMLYGERQLVTYPGSTEYKLFLRDTTEVTAFALLFFGGKLETQYMDSIVTIDGWIRFSATGRIVALVQAIRRAFDQLLEDRITHCGDSSDFSASPILDVTCRLLETDGLG